MEDAKKVSNVHSLCPVKTQGLFPAFEPVIKGATNKHLTFELKMEDMVQLIRRLGMPEEELRKFTDIVKEGKKLVQKCSKLKWWNLIKRYSYSRKLDDLDNSMLRFFQVDMQADIYRDNKRILYEVRQILEILRNGVVGWCDVPAVPDFVVGLELPLQELKLMLLKEENPVVVLSAPGGCGKTTLAKMLCKDEEVKDMYQHNIIFVTVSRTPSLKHIVQKILKSNNYRLCESQTDEEAINQLSNYLRRLVSQSSALLILDDVWTGSDSVIENFMFQIEGLKILVTSRSVFPRFRSTYVLEPLRHQDSMTLFLHSASIDGRLDVQEDLVKKMIKYCGGFPLALQVVGASLRGEPQMIWISTIQRLSEGTSLLDTYKNELLFKLQPNVDALNERALLKLKECFLDFGLFPEDQRITAAALMDIWAESYDLDENGLATHERLHELANRNLVNFVRKDKRNITDLCNEDYATQHYLLRELAIFQSSQEPIQQRGRVILEIIQNKIPKWMIAQKAQPIHARVLSISTDEAFSLKWDYMQFPDVEVLVLNFQTRVYSLPQFMERMSRLKVLILTHYGYSSAELQNFSLLGHLVGIKRIRMEHVTISSISPSILLLENLRKISLSTCMIGNAFKNLNVKIPGLWPNLVELNIDYCSDIVELPVAMCYLDNLKKLSITYCQELIRVPDEIRELKNLEFLRLHSCSGLLELPKSITNLHKLKLLDLSDCILIDHLPAQIGELCALTTINMKRCAVDKLPPSVVKLQQLKEVICSDEETAGLWESFKEDLCNLYIRVLKEDINLHWLHKFHG